jgi:hypothetical protein
MSETEYELSSGIGIEDQIARDMAYQEQCKRPTKADDFDYLIQKSDEGVLKNLSQMGEHLKGLKVKMMAAEAEFVSAKKEFDYYSSSVLPMAMFNAGVSEIRLLDGAVMTYERKFYCQPNKNAADKEKMAEWLRNHGGAHLVKEKASVDGAQIDKLREAGIPYTELDDINTNSLKAFIKDKLGAAGGQAQITITDIPECIHFQEVGIVNIDLSK